VDRLRVATLQYLLRPVTHFDEFRDQVAALVETAAGYDCKLVVFPEYFTVQLLTIGRTRRPIRDQVRDLSEQAGVVLDLMVSLAREHQVHIVAGSVPVAHDASRTMIRNTSYVIGPSGQYVTQEKLHMTRFEREEWDVTPGDTFTLIETEFGRMAVAICYDVEFPEVARVAARHGARILVVPSCTDDRQGFLRVRYCAQARAIENQLYVIHSSTVGSLPTVPAVHLNYGQAAILTPSDFQFPRDGVLAEGNVNQEMMVIGELDLNIILDARTRGTVLPLLDSEHTAQLTRNILTHRI
jgi:predicted amidohydrolase